MNPRAGHRVAGHPDNECGGGMFDQVTVQIKLAIDLVVSREGKPGRQSP